MKYVYVLSSSPLDVYYTQCLMSVYSLRANNKEAEIYLLVDDLTYSYMDRAHKRDALLSLQIKLIVKEFPPKISLKERSRLLKTQIPRWVPPPFLYLDCDTFIVDSLKALDGVDCKIAGVLDGHCELKEHIHRDYFIKRDKRLGFNCIKRLDYTINGGFLLCQDKTETERLFRLWYAFWCYSAYKKHDFHDESALWAAIVRGKIEVSLLGGEWNLQASHGGLSFINQAKIIHYYSSEFAGRYYLPYYKLADKKEQERQREQGFLDFEAVGALNKGKVLFNPVQFITDKRVLLLMQDAAFFTLYDIKTKLKPLYFLINHCAGGIRALGRAFINLKRLLHKR